MNLGLLIGGMENEQINELLNNNGIATYRSGVTCAVFIDKMIYREWSKIPAFLAKHGLVECKNTEAVTFA